MAAVVTRVDYGTYDKDGEGPVVLLDIAVDGRLTDEPTLGAMLDTLGDLTEGIPAIAAKNKEAFGFRCRVTGSDKETLDEPDLFARVAAFDSLDLKVLRYLHNITRFNADPDAPLFGTADTVWHDYRHPGGVFAAEALALKNSTYLAAFVEWLRHIDHEHSDVEEVVGRIFNHWGWREETLDLAAADIFPWGTTLTVAFAIPCGLDTYLQETQGHAAFLLGRFLPRQEDHYGAGDPNVMDSVDQVLEAFTSLTEEERADLRAQAETRLTAPAQEQG